MRVLIACEESQEVCKAFRALGHEAYSCDIQEPSGGHPEWHIFGDAVAALRGGADCDNGRNGPRNRRMGFAHCAPALHIPQQCRGKTPLEKPSTPRGTRHEGHSGPGSFHEVLVG